MFKNRIKNCLRLLSLIILAIILLIISTSCSKPDRAIVGKWEQIGQESDLFFEFFKDGTVTCTGYSYLLGRVTLTGDYKIIDDSHIRVNLEQFLGGLLGGSVVYKFHISGNQLTLACFSHIKK
jgi:hypothetical protein